MLGLPDAMFVSRSTALDPVVFAWVGHITPSKIVVKVRQAARGRHREQDSRRE